MVSTVLRLGLLILTLAAPATVTAQENLTLKLPPGWEVGNHQEKKDQVLVEFVKKGEKIDSWSTELVTVQRFRRRRGAPSARQFYDQLKATIEQRCPALSDWRIVDEEGDTFLYEWTATGACENLPAQWELARLIFGGKTGYRVAYSTRTPLTAEMRATWGEWLRELSLVR